ncbi:hypothetical protein ACHAPM_011259 [Fusarium culmorum]
MSHEIANENGEAESSTLLAPETINGAVSPSPSATSFTSSVETSGSDFTLSWEKLQDVYSQNVGLFYVLLAQLFASIEPFTLNEALAGLIAFTGVLFVARPAFIFPQNDSFLTGSSSDNESAAKGILSAVKATPHERTIAICCSIFGSIAAATAYSTIRVIGKRAHSLVSVNYFAVLATISSFLIITIHPDLQFEAPKSLAEWAILLSIGVSGFLFQVLLTEGLQREKAGRATNLIYVQLVYAVIIDRVIWGTVPPPASFIGSALIIGSAIWVALQKKVSSEPKPVSDEERNAGLDKNGMKEA